jgi:hypothetical protein
MPFVWFVLGAALVALTLLDIFQTVLVPRPTGRRWRPSAFLSRWFWLSWGRLSERFVRFESREDFLGAFGPFMLVALLVFWIATLIVGYGLMFYALRDQIRPVPGFGDAIYFAGTSLLTVGYGDITPAGAAARVLSIFAGASGLGAFAIITAFLFAIFGAYQQRESFVVMFSNRAGLPPSGVHLLETFAELDNIDGLVATLRESQNWIAQVLETHLAYPILVYFRSTHDEISWIAAIGTILDASTLAITTLDIHKRGEATIVNRLGRHFVDDFARYFRLDEGSMVGIDRSEFDRAYERLERAEIPLREREQAWKDFGEIRSTYASQLNVLARYWRIPPAQWIGDRSFLNHKPR